MRIKRGKLQAKFLGHEQVVRVQKRDEFAMCFAEAGIARGRWLPPMWQTNVVHRSAKLVKDLCRVIRRAIVRNDNLDPGVGLVHDTLDSSPEKSRAVIGRDDNTDFGCAHGTPVIRIKGA